MADEIESSSPAVENPPFESPAPAAAAAVADGGQAQPEKNNDTARTDAAGKAGLGERIKRRVSGIFGRAGFNKGKGRPKKCRECEGAGCEDCNFTGFVPGKSDLPNDGGEAGGETRIEVEFAGDKNPAAAENPPVPDSSGGEIFNKALDAGVSVALDLSDALMGLGCDKAGFSPDFTERAIARARARADKNQERFVEALQLWFKEDNIVIQKPGKKAAMITGAAMLLPYVGIIREIRAERLRRASGGK